MSTALQFIKNLATREEELKDTEELRRIKSTLVNDENVDIRYWNSNIGNNSIKVFLGRENVITKHWIQGYPLKVIIHGWLDSMNSTDGIYAIKEAYVKVGGFNVLTVNWSVIALDDNYMVPTMMVSTIANRLAKMLENIVRLGVVRPAYLHLIGHSLGAHLAGMCGSSFNSGKIGRITGLDPAGPGFEFAKIQKTGLQKTDAVFVDVIHTAAGTAGCTNALGHADFYPNGGGSPQPGCYNGNKNVLEVVACSHSRAHRLYEDSIHNMKSMKGLRCPSWDDYANNKCDGNFLTSMGHGASKSARGTFYLRTKATAPFAISDHKFDL